MQEQPAFVLCIESNAILDQALLLIESIRTFGGRHRDAEILAIAPRPALGVDAPPGHGSNDSRPPTTRRP